MIEEVFCNSGLLQADRGPYKRNFFLLTQLPWLKKTFLYV